MNWMLCTLTKTPNGQVLTNPDGTVRSVNPPDGNVTAMPAGTDGPYEQVVIDSGRAYYWPTKGRPFVFGFGMGCPNTDMSVVSEQPIS